MSEWVLFKKKDKRIGVMPVLPNQKVNGEVIETVNGTLEDACKRAEQMELASLSHN